MEEPKKEKNELEEGLFDEHAESARFVKSVALTWFLIIIALIIMCAIKYFF